MQKNIRPPPCSLYFAKRHARLACSVVNALKKARCRYRLFARKALGGHGYLNHSAFPEIVDNIDDTLLVFGYEQEIM